MIKIKEQLDRSEDGEESSGAVERAWRLDLEEQGLNPCFQVVAYVSDTGCKSKSKLGSLSCTVPYHSSLMFGLLNFLKLM